MKEITTKELLKKTKAAEIQIIDIRPVDAYNGWTLMNEKRGGHIPGAKSLPYKWTNYIDWIEMVRHKEIDPSNEIVVYGYSEDESRKVSERFQSEGFDKVVTYNYFLSEWVENNELSLNKLERYQNLISAQWLNQLKTEGKAPHYNNNNYVIVHAHYRNRDAYLSGHIPGAIDMDTLAVEAPESWNRRTPEELKSTFEEHGITADTTVILYGKFMFPDNSDEFPGSAAGDIGAIRIAFIMLYAGVKDVRVLNGGFQ